MNLSSFSPMIKAAVVAAVAAALGWIGISIPESAVQQTVDQQVDVVLDRVSVLQTGGVEESDVTPPTIAEVLYVVDGDTTKVQMYGEEVTLRFIGIDTPETAGSPVGPECYGDVATQRARELLDGQTVIVTGDGTQDVYDIHDRLLVYITLPDGRDVGEVLLQEGLAYEYTYDADYAHQDTYQAAEQLAKQEGRGVWGECSE